MINKYHINTSELSTETPLGIIGLLEEANRKFRLKIAMQIKSKERVRKFSYKKLGQKVIRVSSNLIELGIQFYDRIAILSENRPEWAISYFGILASGSVAVPLDTRLKEKELVYILNNSKTKAIFVSGRHLDTLDKISALCPELKFLICMDYVPERPDLIMLDKFRYRKTIQKSRDSKFSDVAMVVYTSGSTGLPKGVELTYSNLLFQVQTFQMILVSSTDDRVLSVLPLNHALELICGLLGPLYSGACITYLQTSRPEGIVSSMKEIKPSIMTVVPLLVKIIHKAIFQELNNSSVHRRILFFSALNISKLFKKLGVNCGRQLFGRIHRQFGGSLRYMLCGGAPLDKAIARDLDLMGIPILQGYGLTESSPTISVNTLKENRIGSVGKPLPGVEVKILKEHEGDTVGEIITRGPHVMKGYLDDIEKTKEVIKDGWLYTGDLGYLDKEGYLFITGRIKNLIVTGAGKKVQPEELEDLLLKSPYIREACVVGKIAKKGLKKGHEQVYAVIVPDLEHMKLENGELTEDEVKKLVSTEIMKTNKDIADYKKIKGFEIRDGELPKTSTRKVKRKEVLEQVQQRNCKSCNHFN
jgi:long-chain acyl-CoA synthetase